MGGSLPGSSVHGVLQARILELPCPPPGDLPNPEIEPVSVRSLSLASEYFTTSTALIVQFSTDITHAHRHRHRHVNMNLSMFVDPFTPDGSK